MTFPFSSNSKIVLKVLFTVENTRLTHNVLYLKEIKGSIAMDAATKEDVNSYYFPSSLILQLKRTSLFRKMTTKHFPTKFNQAKTLN